MATLKEAWEVVKKAGSLADKAIGVIDLVKDYEILKVLRGLGRDTTKVTVNKRRTKRTYGEAFAVLTRKRRDAIRAIHKKLRTKKVLENFQMNVVLFGDDQAASILLLETLADYSPAEAWELIDDLDLEKEPVHRSQEAIEKAKQLWNVLDAQAEPVVKSVTRSINRARIRGVASNFGIEPPLYRRIGGRLGWPTRNTVILVVWVLVGLAAVIAVAYGANYVYTSIRA